MTKRRGGYTGDQQHELKFRASPTLFEALKSLSEQSQTAMAAVIRQLVTRGLEQKRTKPPTFSTD